MGPNLVFMTPGSALHCSDLHTKTYLIIYFSLLSLTALIACEGGSAGSGYACSNEIGSDHLPLSIPSHNVTGGVFIDPANRACATKGCVTGWRYCYAAKENVNQTSSVPVTFALWRNCTDGFRMVDNSRYNVTVILSPHRLFSCEMQQLDGRCQVSVTEEDAVGVVIDPDAPLHVVGDSEEGAVMVGAEPMEGECVTLKRAFHYTLLVTALVGQWPVHAVHLPSDNVFLTSIPGDCHELMDEG